MTQVRTHFVRGGGWSECGFALVPITVLNCVIIRVETILSLARY